MNPHISLTLDIILLVMLRPINLKICFVLASHPLPPKNELKLDLSSHTVYSNYSPYVPPPVFHCQRVFPPSMCPLSNIRPAAELAAATALERNEFGTSEDYFSPVRFIPSIDLSNQQILTVRYLL